MALHCYRCGTSLAALSLPLSRLEQCPECSSDLHVCRMCEHYAPTRRPPCTKDEAEEVRDDRAANFCDWFEPSPYAYTAEQSSAELAAEETLASLFDDDESIQNRAAGSGDAKLTKRDELALREAEDLFKK